VACILDQTQSIPPSITTTTLKEEEKKRKEKKRFPRPHAPAASRRARACPTAHVLLITHENLDFFFCLCTVQMLKMNLNLGLPRLGGGSHRDIVSL
jgi:hypothetical protein